jgi:hypothetical protein
MSKRNIDPAIKDEYLNWLLTPPGQREPATKKDFAEMHGIANKTLYNWEDDDEFKEQMRNIKVKWGAKWHADLLAELYRIALQSGSDNHRISAIRTLLDHLEVEDKTKDNGEIDDEAAKRIAKFLQAEGFKTIGSD